MQVQTEAQVSWVLGTPKRLSLVQRGQAWVPCPEVPWALFYTNHPLEGFGPKLCTNLQGEPAKNQSGQAENPESLSPAGEDKQGIYLNVIIFISLVTAQGMGRLSSHQVRHSGGKGWGWGHRWYLERDSACTGEKGLDRSLQTDLIPPPGSAHNC